MTQSLIWFVTLVLTIFSFVSLTGLWQRRFPSDIGLSLIFVLAAGWGSWIALLTGKL